MFIEEEKMSVVINNVPNGVKLQYDPEKKVPKTTLEKIEILFDTKEVSQIHIKVGSQVYIIRRKNDGSLEIRKGSWKLVPDKTVQDILAEANIENLSQALTAYQNLKLKNKIIIAYRGINPSVDIEQTRTDNISNLTWKGLIDRHLSRTEHDFEMADYGDVIEYMAQLDEILNQAPAEVKTEFTDRIDLIKTKLTGIEGKKKNFTDNIKNLTLKQINTIANPNTQFGTLIEINEQDYQYGEILIYLKDPEILAMVAIQTARTNPALLTTDRTIFKHTEFDVFSDPKLRTAISKNLPENQRIISFKEEVGGEDVTRYMLVERQSNGTYTIITAEDCKDYDEYSVELDGDQLEVETKNNGTVEADLVVDRQWQRFAHMGLTGDGYKVYQRVWEDGYITKDEAQGKDGLGFSDSFYHFAATGFTDMEAPKGDGISWDDLNEAFAFSADLLLDGKRAEYIKRLVKAPIISRIPTDKAAEKLMGSEKEIKAEKALGLVASDKKDRAQKVILSITGATEYKDDIKLNSDQVAQFLYIMCYDSDQDPTKIKTAENVFEAVKGDKVEGKAEAKGATDKKKDYVSDYRGKSVQKLWAAKEKIQSKMEKMAPAMASLNVLYEGYSKDDLKKMDIDTRSKEKFVAYQEKQDRLKAINVVLLDTDEACAKIIEDEKAKPQDKALAYLAKAEALMHLAAKAAGDQNKARIAQNYMMQAQKCQQKAKELLEKEYFTDGELNSDVHPDQKAIVLYLYARVADNAAEQKGLLEKAETNLASLSDSNPLKSIIQQAIEKNKERFKDVLNGEIEFQVAAQNQDIDKAMEQVETYLASLKVEILKLEAKDGRSKEENKKLIEYYKATSHFYRILYRKDTNYYGYAIKYSNKAIALAKEVDDYPEKELTTLKDDLKRAKAIKELYSKANHPEAAAALLINYTLIAKKAQQAWKKAEKATGQEKTKLEREALGWKTLSFYYAMEIYALIDGYDKNKDKLVQKTGKFAGPKIWKNNWKKQKKKILKHVFGSVDKFKGFLGKRFKDAKKIKLSPQN